MYFRIRGYMTKYITGEKKQQLGYMHLTRDINFLSKMRPHCFETSETTFFNNLK